MPILSKIKLEMKLLKISRFKCVFLLSFPIAVILIFIVLVYLESTREFAINLLRENNLIENLTFIFLFVAGIMGFRLFFLLKKTVASNLIPNFLLFLSFLLLIVAMEEIAWGQQFFRWTTPNIFMKYNVQKELTFHNIKGLQGKSEIFRILFGILGVAGLYVQRLRKYKLISVPIILASFVFTILIVSVFDLSDDYFAISKEIKIGTHLLSELIEMLIGLVSLLYIIFLKRKMEFESILICAKK